MHTTTTSQAFRILGLVACALLLAPVTAAADSDSGADPDDDGGLGMPQPDAGSADGGMSQTDAGSDAGMGSRDGGTDPGVACSCHTDSEAERGQRIHVCTESDDVDVCRDFSCERGTVRSRGCPGDDVQLCCEMRARGLQSYLYEDCNHANCESGFREQCREFGGTVTSGACEGLDGSGGLGGGEDGDDDGGFCAVSTPGSHGGARWMFAVLGALTLVGLRLRRRPAAAGRSPRPAAPRPA